MTPISNLILGLAVVAATGAAHAADIDPILLEAPELGPVETASGWYVRGDVFYGLESDVSAHRTFVTPPFAVTDRYDETRLDEGFGLGAGIGYQATDWFRFDATAAYWSQDLEGIDNAGALCGFDGTCGSRDRADVDAVELMANAYVDLGTIAGFTPYLGGGLGAVHIDYGDVSSSGFCRAGLLCGAAGSADAAFEGESSWRFAYALTGGVSYDVSPSLVLDVGYRYLDVEGGDAYRGDAGPAGLTLAGEDDGFDRHTIRAGLRFRFQ